MINIFGVLLLIGVLYCLAYLPSFIIYVFAGQFFLAQFGGTQKQFFIILNSLIVIFALSMMFLDSKRRQ